jgi:hypothetical protein
MDLYYGLTADQWRTLSIVIQGLLMIILTGIGTIQLMALLKSHTETKRTRTLEICDQFRTDPLFYECKRKLFIARKNGDLAANPLEYRSEIVQVLMFFEALAIGIRRGIYDENIAYCLESPLRNYVQLYLTGDMPEKAELMVIPTLYSNMRNLADKWEKLPTAAALAKFATEIPKKPKLKHFNDSEPTRQATGQIHAL